VSEPGVSPVPEVSAAPLTGTAAESGAAPVSEPGVTPEQAGEQGADDEEEEDDWVPGPTNIPFGPWLSLAALEVMLIGPWLSTVLPVPLDFLMTGMR
jgi:leader peptidase (prepilin peptidase)/N-methyltransferase